MGCRKDKPFQNTRHNLLKILLIKTLFQHQHRPTQPSHPTKLLTGMNLPMKKWCHLNRIRCANGEWRTRRNVTVTPKYKQFSISSGNTQLSRTTTLETRWLLKIGTLSLSLSFPTPKIQDPYAPWSPPYRLWYSLLFSSVCPTPIEVAFSRSGSCIQSH